MIPIRRSISASRLSGRQDQGVSRLVRMLSPRRRQLRSIRKQALEKQIGAEHAQALDLWDKVRLGWPREPLGYCGVTCCARTLGQLDQAHAVAAEALSLFPDNRDVIAEMAQTVEAQGDWAGSVELWDRIVHRDGTPVLWLLIYAHALLLSGAYDKLEAALVQFRATYPAESGFASLWAMLASARGDWTLALERWRDFSRVFPHDPIVWEHYGRAHQELEFARLASSGNGSEAAAVDQVRIDVVKDEDRRTLLLGFESLGIDCQFGMVQRRFGAEPLGLLRFNAVTFGGLMAALANRFQDMGAAQTTELITLPNAEYFIRDRRWGLGMHTFNFVGQIDAKDLYDKFCQRVVFLKRKLLQDLAEARKIFVFYAPGLEASDLRMLHGAMKELGPITLLHVTTLDSAPTVPNTALAGSVRQIEPGLYVGYLSRGGRDSLGNWDIAFDDWVHICRGARAAVDQRQATLADQAQI